MEIKNLSYPAIFFGSEENSVIILKKLVSLPYLKVVAVVTQPPRPRGRKQILTPTPVAQFAQENHLITLAPQKLDQKAIDFLKGKKPKLGILVAYGKIIPQKLIDIFLWGIINIHPSLLPQFRGPTPIEAALLWGQKETGISILSIDSQIDHGPLLAQTKEKIHSRDNQESLAKRLFKIGAETLTDTLPLYLSKQITPMPQNHQKATFTKLLNRDDGYIEYKALEKAVNQGGPKAVKIERKIRAYHPWPGTFTKLKVKSASWRTKLKGEERKSESKRMKILRAHLESDRLILDQIQLEGKNPTNWDKNFQKLIFG